MAGGGGPRGNTCVDVPFGVVEMEEQKQDARLKTITKDEKLLQQQGVGLKPLRTETKHKTDFMQNKSWKTTAAGITSIIAAVAGALNLMFDGNTLTNPDWTSVVASVTAGIVGIAARDNDKSSEDVSAK